MITEQEIKAKCLEWDGMENGNSACRDGIEWAISQMQPEWVECKYGDYIPNGHYVFRLNNNGIEETKSMYVNEEQVDYYYATGYIHIELPQPPTK